MYSHACLVFLEGVLWEYWHLHLRSAGRENKEAAEEAEKIELSLDLPTYDIRPLLIL